MPQVPHDEDATSSRRHRAATDAPVGRSNDSSPTGLTLRAGADHDTVVLRGDLDLATAPQLTRVIGRLLAEGRNRITIDLGEVTFMDASALSALVTAHRDITRSQGTLEVTPNRLLAQLREMTRLPDLFGA